MSLKRILKIADRLLINFEDTLVVILLLAAAFLAFIEVVLRYVFSTSLIWASEVVVVCIIWTVFIGISITLRKHAHIKVDVLVLLLSGKFRSAVVLFATLVGFAFAIFLLYYSVKYTIFLKDSGEISITTNIPEYLYFLALPIGGLLFSIRFIQEVVRVVKGISEEGKLLHKNKEQ
jgi:C4-dicarboxylate transporter DctQ subunit